MTTVTADEPERDEKAVADLERGTWIEVVDADGDYLGRARVLHVETYEDDDLGRRSILIHQMPGYSPDVIRFNADMQLGLLTEDEIAEELDAERRERIASRFDRLADLMRQTETPLPEQWREIIVDVDFGDDVGKLKAVAEAVGVDVRDSPVGSTVSAIWSDVLDHGAGLAVHYRAHRPKPDPTGLAYSREAEDPTPVSGARVEPHVGGVTEAGLVDETAKNRVGTNSGHGHAWERPDGVKARCGGPGLCSECSADQALVR